MRLRRLNTLAALTALLFVVAAPDTRAEGSAPARPAEWAVPQAVTGVPNLHQVTPTFYRSAQPEAEGFKALTKFPGIKTVLSLRAFNSDEPLAKGTGLVLMRIKIHTWNIETEDVVAALAAIRKAEKLGPVLLHCQHGADRTGLISALYRVLYQGWTKEAALKEMLDGGFGYHAIWGNIPRYLREADPAKLKAMVLAKAP